MKRALGTVLVVIAISACGPTIGDSCTTSNDCLGRNCLNVNGTPGGYCTQPCNLSDANTCPTGSICLRDGLTQNSPACFRTCRTAAECRTGYVCQSERGSVTTVCIGPQGL